MDIKTLIAVAVLTFLAVWQWIEHMGEKGDYLPNKDLPAEHPNNVNWLLTILTTVVVLGTFVVVLFS